jgi:hypothetical protein
MTSVMSKEEMRIMPKHTSQRTDAYVLTRVGEAEPLPQSSSIAPASIESMVYDAVMAEVLPMISKRQQPFSKRGGI